MRWETFAGDPGKTVQHNRVARTDRVEAVVREVDIQQKLFLLGRSGLASVRARSFTSTALSSAGIVPLSRSPSAYHLLMEELNAS